jgi:enediyne biosynthesis protein E7
MLNSGYWRVDPYEFLGILVEQYGDIVGFDLGRAPCILVNGAPHVRELFVEHERFLRKPAFVKDSNRGYWGDGLTTLEGVAWQSRRQMLRPSFHATAIPSHVRLVTHCTNDMLSAWQNTCEIDLARELRILTARIAARRVLDADIEGFASGDRLSGVLPFAEAFGEDYTGIASGDPTAPLVMTRPRAPRQMDTVIRIVDERIASREDRGDILSHLIRMRWRDDEAVLRNDVLGEVIQLLYSGHLTVPFTLVNFWRDLADHAIGERIAAEADRLYAVGLPEPAAVSASYCFAALKESIRLQPPAPILYREVETAFELGGFAFARDVAVWVSPQLLHKDPRYFVEPLRFLPDRFLQASGPGVRGAAYLPFGAGPRQCIAMRSALIQMTVITLLTAQQFRSRPVHEQPGASLPSDPTTDAIVLPSRQRFVGWPSDRACALNSTPRRRDG